ncbi:hypothetical protein VNO80_10374 [Phaseolus coccineus]|uniref:Uncharacterized protein n=1 Tax=Phaseolus coccineus TaxID=3886 RepID=A0AAN9NDB8_PHACN
MKKLKQRRDGGLKKNQPLLLLPNPKFNSNRLAGVVEKRDSLVRWLKVAGTPKLEIGPAIETLNDLKLEKTSIDRSLLRASDTGEAFQQKVLNTLLLASLRITVGGAHEGDTSGGGDAVDDDAGLRR